MPGELDVGEHIDGSPAEVTFEVGGLYDPVGQTCLVWCHGGPDRASPPWTGALDGCESCHELPPAPHLTWSYGDVIYDCGACHAEVPADTHVDGRVTARP